MKKLLSILTFILISFYTYAQDTGKNDYLKVPNNVLTGFSAQYPEYNVKQLDWGKDCGYYTAKFNEGERKYKAYFEGDGRWVYTLAENLTAYDLPNLVKIGLIQSGNADEDIGDVEARIEPTSSIYEVELENGIRDTYVYLNENGTILEECE